MSKLSEKVSYLRGLAAGLKLNQESNEGKILAEIIEALDLATQKLDYVEEQVEDLSEYADELDRDLAEVEDYLCEESDEDCEEECDDYCDCDDCNDSVTYECPKCGKEIEFEVDELDDEDELRCTECGEKIFD